MLATMRFTQPSLPSQPFSAGRHDSAEAAAQALADTARRRWAATFNGEYVDDITVAVCFFH